MPQDERGFPPVPPESYEGVTAARNKYRRTMINSARMLACWAVECFPTAPGSNQVHFVRALMEGVAKEMTDALGIPYPIEDVEPAANPVAGLKALLEGLRHSLVLVHGTRTTDKEPRIPTSEWTINHEAEIAAIDAMLGSFREMVA